MQNKYSRQLFLSTEKSLLISCRQEFLPMYKLFSNKLDFSVKCTLKNLSKDIDMPKSAQADFIRACEDLRNDIALQITARKQSITKLENIVARIRFIRLRYRIEA